MTYFDRQLLHSDEGQVKFLRILFGLFLSYFFENVDPIRNDALMLCSGSGFRIIPAGFDAPLGFEPFDSAHGPGSVEESLRLESLTKRTSSEKTPNQVQALFDSGFLVHDR